MMEIVAEVEGQVAADEHAAYMVSLRPVQGLASSTRAEQWEMLAAVCLAPFGSVVRILSDSMAAMKAAGRVHVIAVHRHAIERMFSRAGLWMDDLRSKMSPEQYEVWLLLSSFIRHGGGLSETN